MFIIKVKGKEMLIDSRQFEYKKEMFIDSRKFSYFIDLNRVKLISAIDSIYNEEWEVRGVLPFRKENLQREIMMVKDNHKFAGMDYDQYKKSDITSMLYNMLLIEKELGYLWLIEWESDGVELITVYKCRQPEDLLLLMALSKVILSTMFVSQDHTNIYRLSELEDKHYGLLNQQQNVVKVVKIDLTQSMYYIPKSRLLAKLDSCFQKDRILFNLVKSILFIPIYDSKTDKDIQFHSIPLIGEITKVLMHHFYHIIFDLRLEDKYPGITYTRLGAEVFIVQKRSDAFVIKESDIKNLLEELDIKQYHMDWLYRDDSYILPTWNEKKGLMLYENGDLEVWKYEDI